MRLEFIGDIHKYGSCHCIYNFAVLIMHKNSARTQYTAVLYVLIIIHEQNMDEI